jgi:exopolysaccharide biosynthesis polyprenyl glycosylphosphotransferase
MILLLTETLLVFSCFVLAGYAVLDVDPVVYLLYDGGLVRIAVVVLTMLVALYFHDLYSEIHVRSKMLLFQQCCQVVGIAFIVQALLGYASAESFLPRGLMVYGSAASLAVLCGWRIFYSAVVVRALGQVPVLFLGSSELAVSIAEHLNQHPALGLLPVGYLSDTTKQDLAGGLPWLGALADLRDVVSRVKPERIVVGLKERRNCVPMNALLDLSFAGVRIEEAATAYESTFKKVPLEGLRPSQLVYSGELGPRPGNVAMQLAYSNLIALAGAAVCAPLMLLIALAIKLTSRGPVLYRQTRVGWRGKTFTVYKFRSMSTDAEADTGAVWAAKDDPRVTPVGGWLRRLRMDEIPQFFNVLRGEMSIVGPRPERPEFVGMLSEQIPFYRQRHAVRPGITGWAQISHPYGDTVEDAARKLEYDLFYIKNLSPALDAFIIIQTLKTVLLSRGAR